MLMVFFSKFFFWCEKLSLFYLVDTVKNYLFTWPLDLVHDVCAVHEVKCNNFLVCSFLSCRFTVCTQQISVENVILFFLSFCLSLRSFAVCSWFDICPTLILHTTGASTQTHTAFAIFITCTQYCTPIFWTCLGVCSSWSASNDNCEPHGCDIWRTNQIKHSTFKLC